jgi:mono/diheme cytochrome c family protein
VRGNRWKYFTALFVTTALVFGLSAVSSLPAAEPQNISAIAALKPGKGRELVQANCIPCHSTAIIAATHATRARWDELITTMQQRHGLWPLLPAIRAQILDYLEATQPPADPALDTGKQTPWAGPLYRPNPLW